MFLVHVLGTWCVCVGIFFSSSSCRSTELGGHGSPLVSPKRHSAVHSEDIWSEPKPIRQIRSWNDFHSIHQPQNKVLNAGSQQIEADKVRVGGFFLCHPCFVFHPSHLP